MKISSVSAIIGSFCLLLQGQAIASQVSFSSLLRVPAVQKTCELEAQSLQNKIASVRGVSEAQVECRGNIELEEKGTTYKLYSLNIQYKAPVALPYTANFAADQLQVPIGSLYPAHQSYGECLLALEDQKKIFERETKLEAVVSACQRVEFSSETLYTIRIEGFGKPEKTLQYAGIKVSPLNHSQLYTEVEKLFRNSRPFDC